MADIRMHNPALDMDLTDLNNQGKNMSNAITEFTALVQANLRDFTGLSATQLTDTTNQLNGQSSSMVKLLADAGIALEQMIEAINLGDSHGSRIIAG